MMIAEGFPMEAVWPLRLLVMQGMLEDCLLLGLLLVVVWLG